MKIHSTNYFSTLIAVADDCPVSQGTIPPEKGEKRTLANLQFELLHQNPYKYTSDDIIFLCYARKNDIKNVLDGEERRKFYSKGQPCMRTSPLTKKYGWGIYNDKFGKIALLGAESEEYKKRLTDKNTSVVRAMRSSRKK